MRFFLRNVWFVWFVFVSVLVGNEDLSLRYPVWKYVFYEFDLPFEFIDNPDFVRYAERNTERMKRRYETVSSRNAETIRMVRSKLLRQDMSDLFLYQCIVESNLKSDAKSPKNAVGMWQFIDETAKRYGLRRNGGDGRLDPEASTEAAIRYTLFVRSLRQVRPMVFGFGGVQLRRGEIERRC